MEIFEQELLRIQWMLSKIFKTSSETVWSNAFWNVKNMFILKGYSIHYTLR